MGGFAVIPWWKLRREVNRLAQQLNAIPEFFWEPIARRRHDRSLMRGFPITIGAQDVAPKVAILLLYQPSGLAKSVALTCRHLTETGHAVLIVSNTPLSDKDRASLATQVWRIIERPNFGYDFGGYRDGLWHLSLWGIRPERLVILNDSIWFPLRENDTTLARMEAMPVDVAGTILRERGAERFLESYLFSMRGAILQHPAFQTFWRDFRLTSNKYKVIRRGERGFSAALWNAGFKLHPMFSATMFLSLLRQQDDAFLEKTIQFGVAMTASQSAEREAILLATRDKDWRSAALNHIERVLQSSQFYSAFPYASVQLLNYPILKRSGDMALVLWRRAYLAAIEAGELDAPMPEIAAELRTQVTQDAGI